MRLLAERQILPASSHPTPVVEREPVPTTVEGWSMHRVDLKRCIPR